jgi:hypothetical protein
MKQAIILAVLFTAGHFCFSTNAEANTFTRTPVRSYNDSAAVKIPTLHEMLAQIMNVTGLQTDFELKEAKVLNIEASISHRKRYILYNPSFIEWINLATKDKWGSIALLAHEIGHHLNGHTIRKSGSNPSVELQADEFAGFILHKLGATLQESQEVMFYIAKPEGSATHPGRTARMEAIKKGWQKVS